MISFTNNLFCVKSVLLVLTAIVTVGASSLEKPIWERNSRYLCRSDKQRICTGLEEKCLLRGGQAVGTIDFTRNTFDLFGGAPEDGEKIVWKKYRFLSKDRSIQAIFLSGGARMISFGNTTDPDLFFPPDTFYAKFVSADTDDVITDYMICAPTK